MKGWKMNRMNLIAMLGVLAVVAMVVVPSCGPAGRQQPTSQSAMASSNPAQQGLPEGGLEFNSKLPLLVWVGYEDSLEPIDETPAAQPLAIPKCQWWAVQPLKGVSVATVREEAKSEPIGGIMLEHATDADLAQLSGWHKLRTLELCGGDITNAGLAYLEELKTLQRLNLYGTTITDAGLVHIKELSGLQTLILDGTKVTDAGVKELRKAMPNTYIRN